MILHNTMRSTIKTVVSYRWSIDTNPVSRTVSEILSLK